MMFNDRADAAHQLAEALIKYRGQHPLVLAIPRGAVPMARIIAERLGGSCDVVLVRKLRAPFNDELAIGSVGESGWVYLADYAKSAGATDAYVANEKKIQIDTIRARRLLYTPVRPPIDPVGRIVIVVDDGLATGATMISALHGLRNMRLKKLICAVPVSPASALDKVAKIADEVICLDTPDNFQAVGQFYTDFPQIEDNEVVRMLRDSQELNAGNIYETHGHMPDV